MIEYELIVSLDVPITHTYQKNEQLPKNCVESFLYYMRCDSNRYTDIEEGREINEVEIEKNRTMRNREVTEITFVGKLWLN